MKSIKSACNIAGLVSIVVAIFCLIIPLFAPQALPIIAGIVMILMAVFLTIVVKKLQRTTLPLSWIIDEIVMYSILGILLIFSRFIPVPPYAIMIIWTILFTTMLLRYSLLMRSLRFSHWWLGLALSIFSAVIVIASFFLVVYAEVLFIYLLAFYFILMGMAIIMIGSNSTLNAIEKWVRMASGFVNKFKARRLRKKQAKETQNSSDPS